MENVLQIKLLRFEKMSLSLHKKYETKIAFQVVKMLSKN